MQLEWLGVDVEKDSPYHLCRYAIEDEVLTVDLVNDDVVGSGIKTSAKLREILLVNRSNPALFHESKRYRQLEE